MKVELIANKTNSAVADFLSRAPLNESILALDGMGVNSAYHYFVLSALGFERLTQLNRLIAISAANFPTLFFTAMATGHAKWTVDDLIKWDVANRKAHGVSTLRSLPAFVGWKLGMPFAQIVKPGGFSEALKLIVSEAFLAQTVSDLPIPLVTPLYDKTTGELCLVSRENPELSDMPLSVLVNSAPSIEGIFAPIKFKTRTFVDPIFSPVAKGLIKRLTGDTKNALVSSLVTERREENRIYMRPHDAKNGQNLFLKDLILFLGNLPNKSIYRAAKAGLTHKMVP